MRRRRKANQTAKTAALYGCGIDVVELARFRRALEHGGKAFMRRVFTEKEQAYARQRRHTTLLHLAARFAAKEAIIKAMGQVDPRRVPPLNKIEIYNDEMGRPHVTFLDGRIHKMRIHISLSHVPSVAVASAFAIRGKS